MENNNGRGIFYGVIGVATLVVAIIGATFAYFSATVTSENAISGVNSTVVNLTYTAGTNNNLNADLIPVQTEGNNAAGVDMGNAFKRYPGNNEWASDNPAYSCKDNVGNSICSVYQFTIGNPNATTAQTVVGSLTVSQNTGFSNLHYALFKGTIDEVEGKGFDVNADEVDTDAATATSGTLVAKGTFPAKDATDKTVKWDKTEELLAGGGSTTYTIVIWLEEEGASNDVEQGQSFAASITFSSPSGSGVTGVLTLA